MMIRMKFLKGEEIKYISHLDLMRTVQRVIRRSHIPIAYSHGFNPHQEISFGAPLPLGVTSEAEYVDLKMGEAMSPEKISEIFNGNAPAGVRMLGGMELAQGAKSAMALVTHSAYRLSVVLPYVNIKGCEGEGDWKKRNQLLVAGLNEKLNEFLKQDEITIVKYSKKTKTEKSLNVRPLVLKCSFTEAPEEHAALLGDDENGAVIMECLVKSGSTDNIKPELLVEAFGKFLNGEITVRRIHRTELYQQTKDGGLVDLFGKKCQA